ncbi:MAG: DUF3108 domain-containing protein [Dysgonamonadaceae bacterium]|jgi:hypothetical protein|nr:DUF3108 domain-containing protein [Dysgonamonadaceae bacterium]
MKAKLLSLSILLFSAVCLKAEIPFQSGEELKFNITYKYGLVMVKAGTADFKIRDSHYGGSKTLKTILTFKTNSFFDKIFKMRDTLYSQINLNMAPLYHFRTVNEGSTTFTEEMTVRKYSDTRTEVRVRRESTTISSFDTTLYADAPGYDMLNLILYARSLDCPSLTAGDKFNIATFVGRDMININVRYKGISTIKLDGQEVSAHHIAFDMVDEAFKESRDAVEFWLSGDENRIPLKIRAKLKIGAAEVELVSSRNLKYQEQNLANGNN